MIIMMPPSHKWFLILFSILFIILLGVSFFVPHLTLKLIIGFSFVFLIKTKNLDSNLNQLQGRIFNAFIFIYPVLATGIKVLEKYWITGYQNPIFHIQINQLEHFMGGVALGVVLLPLIITTLNKVTFKEKMIIFIPVVSFFSLIYELSSYYIFYGPTPSYSYLLYADTMHDLSLNIAGALLAFILLVGLVEIRKKGN